MAIFGTASQTAVQKCLSVTESSNWHYVHTSLVGSTIVWEIVMFNKLYQLKY